MTACNQRLLAACFKRLFIQACANRGGLQLVFWVCKIHFVCLCCEEEEEEEEEPYESVGMKRVFRGRQMEGGLGRAGWS